MTLRLAIILLLGGIAAGGLYSFQRYLDNPNSAINRAVPDSWLTKSRLAGIAAHFPAEQNLPRRDGRPDYPPADLAIPERTETALFALG